MDRRGFLSMLGTTGLSLLALAASARFGLVLAKDSSGGGSSGGSAGSGTASGSGSTKDTKPPAQDGGNNTDQPGTEAQPQDATQCAAGIDCKKK